MYSINHYLLVLCSMGLFRSIQVSSPFFISLPAFFTPFVAIVLHTCLLVLKSTIITYAVSGFVKKIASMHDILVDTFD
jgi:hypothetical protein